MESSNAHSALRKIAIFGAGGFGLELAMMIEQINEVSLQWELIGFFDDGAPAEKIINGYPVLGGIEKFNYRQRTIIAHALRHPNYRYTIKSHQRSHMLFYSSASLAVCVEKRILLN